MLSWKPIGLIPGICTHWGLCTVPSLLTGPPLCEYLLYPDVTMNSQIIDFYYLFTSVNRIFHLSRYNPFVPRHPDNTSCTVCLNLKSISWIPCIISYAAVPLKVGISTDEVIGGGWWKNVKFQWSVTDRHRSAKKFIQWSHCTNDEHTTWYTQFIRKCCQSKPTGHKHYTYNLRWPPITNKCYTIGSSYYTNGISFMAVVSN